MTIRKIDKENWTSYFDRLSKALRTKQVSIEVSPLGIGHQTEAKSLALGGLVYDHKSDLFEVQTENLDHLIHGPVTIFVDETDSGVTSVEVVDSDGTKQLIVLSQPVEGMG